MVRFERQALHMVCLLSLAETTAAFSTTRPFQSIKQQSSGASSLSRHPIRKLDSVIVLTEPASRPSSGEATNSDSLIDQKTVDAVFGNAAIVGEDVFLANLESTTPETVFAEADGQESVVLVSKTADPATKIDLPKGDLPKTIFTYSRNSTDNVLGKNLDITENVEAVLAASQDAMLAAEASLPPEIKKELSSFGTNGTETRATTKVDSTTTTIKNSVVSTSLEGLVDIVPAKEVVGEPVTKTIIEAPAVMTILKFAVPAVGVWLCSPLLSLIDTSAVGILSGTTQQAALNPAVAVTDYAALLIAFLYTATTNMVASAQETDRTLPGKPKTTACMIGAMQLSTYVGLGLGSLLFIFARPLLRAIIGNDGIDPAVFAAAMKYVRIRALGMPAAAIIGSAQAACLGCKDIRSPLYVLLAAAVVNFFGDMMFVGSKSPIIGGAAGAAWATVFSQYAALAIFIRWLVKKPKTGDKPKVVNLTKNILDFMGKPDGGPTRNKLRDLLFSNRMNLQARAGNKKTVGVTSKVGKLFGKLRKPKSSPGKPKEEVESVRGLLEGHFRGVDLVKLPSKEIAKEFSPYVTPVTVTQIGRVSGYVAMSHVVSSSLGTVSMAAQQVIVSFFYCLCPIADSLSLTAQSFIPGISERKPSKERADALRTTGRNFMKAGGVFGGVMAAAIGLLPILSRFFTSDPAVVALVNMVIPILLGFFIVHGVLCASEGVLLGQKDLGFLGKMYGTYFFAVPFFMMRVKRAAMSGVAVNLTSVWTVFLGYQMFRLLAWVSRVEIIQKRTDRALASLEDSM